MTSPDLGFRFVSADTLPLTVVWRAFLEGFRDYLVPVQIDERPFADMLEWEQVDLAASVVALDNSDEPTGVCLLAIRERDAWCGGLGIAPPYRRRGLGRTLMIRAIDGARSRRLDRIRLECIDGNDAALNLYLGLGFRVTRRLDLFDGAPAADAAAMAAEVHPMAEPTSVWQAFPAYHPVPRPWQQDLPCLRLTALRGSIEGLAIGDHRRPNAYLLFRPPEQPGGRVSIVDAGWMPGTVTAGDAFGSLVATLVAHHHGTRLFALNVPADDGLNVALRAANVPVTLTQSEMVLDLSGSGQPETATS